MGMHPIATLINEHLSNLPENVQAFVAKSVDRYACHLIGAFTANENIASVMAELSEIEESLRAALQSAKSDAGSTTPVDANAGATTHSQPASPAHSRSLMPAMVAPPPTNPFDCFPWKPGIENPKDGEDYLIRFKETPGSFYFCKIFQYSPTSTIDQIEFIHPHEIIATARVVEWLREVVDMTDGSYSDEYGRYTLSAIEEKAKNFLRELTPALQPQKDGQTDEN